MSEEQLEVEQDVTPETASEETEDKNVAIADENNPLNAQSTDNLQQLLKNIESMVQLMQSQWEASARELDLKDVHMRQLAVVNDRHKVEPPADLDEEGKANWDYLNGIDHITDEEIDEIFEEGHAIRGVDHSQTVDRIKGACQDFFGWLSTLREYRNVQSAYFKLIELEEEKQVEQLKAIAENETDEKKKADMLASVEQYYNRKYLKWLADPVDDIMKQRILKALGSTEKVQYMINRTRDKLQAMNISSKFILELAQFEKRYLDEKYHENSNVLLLYFMYTCMYSDAKNKSDDARIQSVCMVMGIDGIIRNTWEEEKRTEMLNNIIAFEDQFLGLCPKSKE